MNFDEWIASLFDRPVTKQEWSWDDVDPFWAGPAATLVDYMTRLFAEADTLLQPYSDAQAYQGLYAVISNTEGEYTYALLETTVPLPARLGCIAAMETLFADYFARRCTPYLSHLDEPGASPLNGVCYMWWDILPLHSLARHRPEHPDGPELDLAILSVIQNCLEIDAIACQESAIHGLFEWSPYVDIAPIAEDFLRRNPNIRPELRAFATRHAIHFPRHKSPE